MKQQKTNTHTHPEWWVPAAVTQMRKWVSETERLTLGLLGRRDQEVFLRPPQMVASWRGIGAAGKGSHFGRKGSRELLLCLSVSTQALVTEPVGVIPGTVAIRICHRSVCQ